MSMKMEKQNDARSPPLATEVSLPEEKLVGNLFERRSGTVSIAHSIMFTGH